MSGYLQLLLRLAKEDKSLRAGHFPAVLPIVFYTGDAPWNAPPDTLGMFEAALRERLWFYLPKQGHVLIDLCRLDAGGAELRDSLTALLARFRQAKTFEEIRAVLADMARVLRNHPELQRVFVDFTALWMHRSGVPGNWERELNNIEEVYDMLSIDVASWRDEFLAQGLAQGLAKGREEGRSEGREEGLTEGALEEKKATVRQLLKMGGFSPESIAEITRLPIEDVRAIAESEGR